MIRFDGNGQFDAEITELLVQKRLKNVDTAVVPGFYGAKENGEIKTLLEVALMWQVPLSQVLLDVDLYENWTTYPESWLQD